MTPITFNKSQYVHVPPGQTEYLVNQSSQPAWKDLKLVNSDNIMQNNPCGIIIELVCTM